MRLLWIIIKSAAVIILLAVVGIWLADQPGRMVLTWRGWQVDTSVAFIMLTMLLLCLLVWKIGKLFFWLRYRGARQVERRLRQRQQDGLRLLTASLNALASQDLRAATKAQELARKKLGNIPLLTWVSAQIASARHDYKTAGTAFLMLTQEPSAANLGWRGLMAARQQTALGRTQLQPLLAGALADKRIARQAYVHEARFANAARTQDWVELRMALDDAARHHALPKPRLRQVEQGLLLARGQSLQLVEPIHQQSQPSQARLLLERAYRLAPDFSPAAIAYIDMLLNGGARNEAGKIIAAAWLLNPSHLLFERFKAAYENETALARLQRFEQFALKRQDNVVTQLALGQLSLDAELVGKARTHAEQAQALQPSAPGGQLLARVLLAAQGQSAANSTAIPLTDDGHYQCQTCQARHVRYHFLCDQCGAFATLQPDNGQASLGY